MRAYKKLCFWVALAGIVHLESLARNAIVFHFFPCGVPGMKREIAVLIHFVLTPVVAVGVVMFWRKKELLDRLVRICGLSYFGAFAIYGYFECYPWGNWIAYW